MSLSTAVTDPPTLSQPQRPSVHSSDAPIEDTPPPPCDNAYEGLNWGRIPGYIRPNNTSGRRGWIPGFMTGLGAP
ncbi:Glutarate-semialdehyde dehydrogenase DavD [Fusarium oxysporum f. sp. albedinis]|nr:Glutarate-semialdehyde dehydrogenase DavD [Fusarium oxysporum f. sp. albedinis]